MRENPGWQISGDTRADWSGAFELVPGLEVAYVWHASKFTREVLDGLLRIGFIHHQQIIWDKGRTVLTRTLYWFQHEPCWFVRKKNAPWYGKAARTPPSGHRPRRSSSWAGPMRTSSITPHRSRWNSLVRMRKRLLRIPRCGSRRAYERTPRGGEPPEVLPGPGVQTRQAVRAWGSIPQYEGVRSAETSMSSYRGMFAVGLQNEGIGPPPDPQQIVTERHIDYSRGKYH